MTQTKPAPRSTLSRDLVVERALAMTDADGIDAVTIRRLATELGVTPMALYWHFKTKDDLLAGMGDRVLDDVVVPEPLPDWAADLGAVLGALVAAMRPHPQVAVLAATRMMTNPTGLDLTERVLSRLVEAGFDPERACAIAIQALRTAIGMVTGDLFDASGMSAQERGGHLRQKQAVIASLDPQRFPALVSHAAALTYCDVDTYVGVGIDLYVAGVRGLAGAPS